MRKFHHHKIINIVLTAWVWSLGSLAAFGIVRCIIGLLMGDFNNVSFGYLG